MKRYIPHIKKKWYCFILAPMFMMLEACGEFILPYINANIINKGAATGDIAYIVENGLIMAVLAASMLVTGVLGAFFAVRGASGLAAGVRADTFRKIQTFSFADIDRFTTGSLITRITNDVTQIQNFCQSCLRGMFRSPIMVIGALIMSFSLNASLARVMLLVVALLAMAIAAIILSASPRYTKMQRQLDRLNTKLNEMVVSMRVIKSFVREEHERKRFDLVNHELVKRSISALKMMLLMQPASALAINVTTLLVVWISGKQIMVGSMELGTLTAFITYLSQVLNGLDFIANLVLQGTRAAASHRRIGEVLDTVPDIADGEKANSDAILSSGAVEFRDVSFRYFKNSPGMVLDHVRLSIASGELVGVVGSTGSGKTTLISMIPRLYDPDVGEVYLDGVNVRDLALSVLRENVSVVLQKNTLFSGTIAENLRWGSPEATDEQIVRAAKLAQAHEFISSFPEGYDTEIGRGGSTLSGGQKQRICIARALLKKPKVLILDDSTSAVDTKTDAAIRRALRKELPGVTKIIIAQRIDSIADADKIIVMDEGRVVGVGTHDTLYRTCPTYAQICLSQREGKEDAHE